jgi:hypothetical protein
VKFIKEERSTVEHNGETQRKEMRVVHKNDEEPNERENNFTNKKNGEKVIGPKSVFPEKSVSDRVNHNVQFENSPYQAALPRRKLSAPTVPMGTSCTQTGVTPRTPKPGAASPSGYGSEAKGTTSMDNNDRNERSSQDKKDEEAQVKEEQSSMDKNTVIDGERDLDSGCMTASPEKCRPESNTNGDLLLGNGHAVLPEHNSDLLPKHDRFSPNCDTILLKKDDNSYERRVDSVMNKLLILTASAADPSFLDLDY